MEISWLKVATKQAKKLFPNKHALAQLQKIVDGLKYWEDQALRQSMHIKQLQGRRYHEIWELSSKGGTLGKANVRVFFAVTNSRIFILGVVKKEREDSFNYVYETMLNRLLQLKEAQKQVGLTG